MAKTLITATSDLGELVSDLMKTAEEFPDLIEEAAKAEMEVFTEAIRQNWVSMVPWGKAGDYVYDSIGYNVDKGNDGDVVGMAGVFLIDSVGEEHGKNERYEVTKGPNKGALKSHIKAPQLAYWAEYGTNRTSGYPFMANAFYMSVSEQDKVFFETLNAGLDKRLSK